MTLKAIIPSGQTEITVNGLHQWDYGQKLEIHSADLGAIVEVHFACAGMKEAVVRTCENVEGVAVATIPDRCLEQTTPITAWVFEKDSTQGLTTKTITLPIIPRTKPQPGASVPEDHADTYSELIAAVNKAVGKLTDGTVKVHYAYNADHASSATDADNASKALRATEADHATEATTVDAVSKTVTATTSAVSDSIKVTVELDEDSTYIIEAPDGSGGGVTFMLHVVNKLVSASCTAYSTHHILSYNPNTKTLVLRRYRFLPDTTDMGYEIGYQTFGAGSYTLRYAKIANLI